jgi:hypothetical protein
MLSRCLLAKKNKFSFVKSSLVNEKLFWEELRDVQTAAAPKRGARSTVIDAKSIPENQYLMDAKSKLDEITTTTSTTESSLWVAQSVSPLEKYLGDNFASEALSLAPSSLSSLQEISTSKHAADVLVSLAVSDGTPIVLMAGLHRIAQLATKKGPTHRAVILADHRFGQLLESVSKHLETAQPIFLSNVLWSIGKLEVVPPWRAELVDHLTRVVDQLPPSHVASCLYTLASDMKRSGKSCSQSSLVDSLVGTVTPASYDTHALISVGTSLARLGRVDKNILRAISDRLIASDDIGMDDMVSVMWSFTSLNVTDKLLVAKFIRALENRIQECSKRNLIDSVWVIAKAESVDPLSVSELFRFTMAPAIRSHMTDLSVRELATVVWSYATVAMFDGDFYNDLAIALSPKCPEMNAHDITSVVWSLASVGKLEPGIVKGVKGRIENLGGASVFSPLQLSRIIFGLGFSDEALVTHAI